MRMIKPGIAQVINGSVSAVLKLIGGSMIKDGLPTKV
jgi:hypothetical protein